MRKFGSRWYWALLALLVVALAMTMIACPEPEEEPTPTPPPVNDEEPTPPPDDEEPAIEITDPEQTDTVSGDFTVSVEVENFELVDRIGEPPVEGEGHIIYYLNIQPPTEPGQPAIPANDNEINDENDNEINNEIENNNENNAMRWVATADESYDFENVPPGMHTVYVQLVNNDHTPLEPPVMDQVQIEVEEEDEEEEEEEEQQLPPIG